MRRWQRPGLLGPALAIILLLAVAAYGLPVRGAIWRESQVISLAIVSGGGRTETESRAAISEAMTAARMDRLKPVLSLVRAVNCRRPQDLEFLTSAGWVPVRINCPDGFFLDFIPRPGLSRISPGGRRQ